MKAMLHEKRIPPHPGTMLLEEYLAPFGINHIGVHVQRVNEIVRGKRGATPETAWLLSQDESAASPIP